MKMQLFTEGDLAYLDDLKPEGWGDIFTPHKYYLSHSFCRTMKITSAGKPVAIGTTINHGNTAWLAHIIVHRDCRGQGLGNRIVSGLLSDLSNDKEIETVSLIATDLGYPLYLKNGFVEQTVYHFYELPEDKTFDSPLSPMIFPYNSSMENSLLQLDREVIGEDRSEYLRDKLPGAFAYLKNGLPEGFSIPDLGDGLTIAKSDEAGIELLKLIMNRGNKVVIPRENIIAGDFLRTQGYGRGKSARRMTYGSAFPWKPENLFNRIGGKLG